MRLEEKVLTVTDVLRPLSWKAIDCRLHLLPCGLPSEKSARFSFMVDLDRQIFSVDYGAHFKLNNIPRDGLWIRALGIDGNERMLNTTICPEDAIAHPAWNSEPNKGSQNQPYYGCSCTIVEDLRTTIHTTDIGAPGQVIALLLFTQFYEQYQTRFRMFLPQWRPEDFIFREVAFAILSLAAGQFQVAAWDKMELYAGNGYLLVPDEETCDPLKAKLLPEFPMGYHRPDERPGSAPDGCIYWLGNVLVSLEMTLQDPAKCHVAIERAVEFGLGAGRNRFRAVIFSLVDVVLLQVRLAEDGTRILIHTEAKTLLPIEHSRNLSADPPLPQRIHGWIPTMYPSRFVCGTPMYGKAARARRDPQSISDLCHPFPGFISLCHFFNMAAAESLKPRTRTNEARLPMELCYKILDYTDDITYRLCSYVSWGFREYYQKNMRFGNKHLITKCTDELKFTFVNHRTKEPMNCTFVVKSDDVRAMATHYPIIGLARPSILGEVGLTFRSEKAPDKIDLTCVKRLREQEMSRFDIFCSLSQGHMYRWTY
jgi:hypothetical protein